MTAPFTPETMPTGHYAILEALGHSTMVGRVAEVERFGTKMLQIEPLFRGFMLGPVYVGGASIYRLTPCEPAVALDRQAQSQFDLPQAVFATVPEHALAPLRLPPFLTDERDAFCDDRDGQEDLING